MRNIILNIILNTSCSATSRCILVPFEWCGCPKKYVENVLVTFFPYIFHVKTKWNIVIYEYLNTHLFKKHKYPSPNALNIKYSWTLNYNHWVFLSITKLSNRKLYAGLIVCTPSLFENLVWGWASNQIFKKGGGLFCSEKGVTFFPGGGLQFSHKK